MPGKLERKIITKFHAQPLFSRQDLLDYFLQNEEELNEKTFTWRIHDLKKRGIIKEVKRGWYSVYERPKYTHQINESLRKISNLFRENYNNAKYCVWNIDWLNDFTVHQFTQSFNIIETEKDLTDSLGNFLHDRGYKNIITPTEARLDLTQTLGNAIIIAPLITRAPIQEINLGQRSLSFIPTLEKILVDVYNEGYIFNFIKGTETIRIFENALFRYSINFTTLFSYAKRRNKGEDIKDFLLNHNLIKSDFL